MNRCLRHRVIPAALALMLTGVGAARSHAQVLEITPNFQPDPLELSGQSGGPNNTSCGYLSQTPNHAIKLDEPLPYLRFSVQGQGDPTLLIEGPGGRFCVLADNISKGSVKISGYWETGTYLIYVGDRAGGQYPYALSISQTSN